MLNSKIFNYLANLEKYYLSFEIIPTVASNEQDLKLKDSERDDTAARLETMGRMQNTESGVRFCVTNIYYSFSKLTLKILIFQVSRKKKKFQEQESKLRKETMSEMRVAAMKSGCL